MCVSFYSPRRAGQRALAPPTDGHPPDFRKPQRQFNHYTTISPTIHEPLSTPDTDTTNRFFNHNPTMAEILV